MRDWNLLSCILFMPLGNKRSESSGISRQLYAAKYPRKREREALEWFKIARIHSVMHFVELNIFKIEMKSVVYIYIIVGTWRNVNNVKEKSINARIPFNAKFHHIIFFNLLCAGGKCLGMLRKIFWKFLIQSAKAQRNEILKKRSALNHYKVKLNSEGFFFSNLLSLFGCKDAKNTLQFSFMAKVSITTETASAKEKYAIKLTLHCSLAQIPQRQKNWSYAGVTIEQGDRENKQELMKLLQE